MQSIRLAQFTLPQPLRPLLRHSTCRVPSPISISTSFPTSHLPPPPPPVLAHSPPTSRNRITPLSSPPHILPPLIYPYQTTKRENRNLQNFPVLSRGLQGMRVWLVCRVRCKEREWGRDGARWGGMEWDGGECGRAEGGRGDGQMRSTCIPEQKHISNLLLMH